MPEKRGNQPKQKGEKMESKSMIEHARFHRPRQPFLYRLEGIVLAAGVVAAYLFVAWLHAGG